MRSRIRVFVTTFCLVTSFVLPANLFAADSNGSSDEWSVDAKIDARLRYEYVDDDAATDQANATTLRTRAALEARRSRWGLGLEFEDISAIGSARFNDTANGRTRFATVADPEATEVNRAWLSYKAPKSIGVTLGRQRINRDGGRIIGDVGWRQNQQTYDAVTAERSAGRYRFFGGYLAQANRIFGDDHPSALSRQFELDGWVGEGSVVLGPGTVTAVLHYFEFENDPLRSHRNVGLRWIGKHELNDKRHIRYRAEWIDQEPHSNGAAINEAEYLALEVGYEARRWGVGANLEQLGGDGMYGFQRPLATLHAYNGWADRFLNTPADGLVDVFLNARFSFEKFVLKAQYHSFEADNGSADYGDEFGLALSRKLCERVDAVFKYAHHDADGIAPDVQKVWLSVRLLESFDLRRK
ncbi:MAG: alginate export family protein [Acidobacteria bacterium]|nr:alginate export family protein [Acidobacteriota bacterium]NIM60143.1 alginate export family protein [Acidobacteriota bacterium]NIO57812.1 alginate export family protein [Acidobacteriota bacterium]NIQ28821.1 alginate export family protein [Acidobacteriota bacterium]NIQ83279.1 alginate export family protein [Acidobacteriota bacterium]